MKKHPGKPGLDPDFWQGRRVLLTGHTGFKGSWLSLWLRALGADVTGFALSPPSAPSLFDLAHVGSDMHSLIGDVRDAEPLVRAVMTAAPEVVIHMAAQPLVRTGYARPVDTYATNVMGTVNLLEAVRNTETVRSVLIVTSDKCYRNQGWQWGYRESDQLGGHDPYSSSKSCAELVTAAYRESYFQNAEHPANIATARAGNVIGGGDWATDRLIPDIIRAFSASEPVLLRNPAACRPWQHVVEPLFGYLMLCQQLWESDRLASGWNLGPHDEDTKPVDWVVQKMAQLWGDDAQWGLAPGAQPREDQTLRLDCARARSILGWTPQLTLPQALEWTVRWYTGQARGEDVREMTLDQIRDYQTLANGLEQAARTAEEVTVS